MSFRTFIPKTAAKRVAAKSLDSVMPQPPATPTRTSRKRGRASSPDASKSLSTTPSAGRRLVAKHKPPVHVDTADSTHRPWTEQENVDLRAAVMQYGERKRDWPKVANLMSVYGRDKDACREQWLRLRPPVKGSWTPEEDKLLTGIVTRQGASGWSGIAKHIAGRNAKQCRERWVNHLNPGVKKSQWTAEEDALLLRVQQELGNRWSEIAKHLDGRPDNAVKNRWYTLRHRAGDGPVRRKTKRKSSVNKQPTPVAGATSEKNLTTLLKECAAIDFERLDPAIKVNFATLASRFSELAQQQRQSSSHNGDAMLQE